MLCTISQIFASTKNYRSYFVPSAFGIPNRDVSSLWPDSIGSTCISCQFNSSPGSSQLTYELNFRRLVWPELEWLDESKFYIDLNIDSKNKCHILGKSPFLNHFPPKNVFATSFKFIFDKKNSDSILTQKINNWLA